MQASKFIRNFFLMLLLMTAIGFCIVVVVSGIIIFGNLLATALGLWPGAGQGIVIIAMFLVAIAAMAAWIKTKDES